MCGRYTLTRPAEALERLFDVGAGPGSRPRYNVAPTQPAPVLRIGPGGGRRIETARWGWTALRAGDGGAPPLLINARAETVPARPAFREAFATRRCLVPADGFYEWRRERGRRQAFRIGFEGGAPFAMAGLWEKAGDSSGRFVVVTTAAPAKFAPIHPRFPLIVAAADHDAWLSGDAAAARALLRPPSADGMAHYRVGDRVNDARNDDPACVAPMARRPRERADCVPRASAASSRKDEGRT